PGAGMILDRLPSMKISDLNLKSPSQRSQYPYFQQTPASTRRVLDSNDCSSTRPSDYDLYPRVLQDDAAFCAAQGVDYIFAPPDDEMYPEPQRAFVEVGEVSEHCAVRPGRATFVESRLPS
ncbi:MAG TPA: pantoate--beta-alanine ligase, partial [Edaphobacter sp.]|nr:pantoate--beta-alanine ligase [Edaphobacter sp.]